MPSPFLRTTTNGAMRPMTSKSWLSWVGHADFIMICRVMRQEFFVTVSNGQ